MYLQNKYTKCYYSIIERAKSRDLPKETYTERHHIIPRSLGGANDPTNLVRLTAKEHRLAHILLPRMTVDPIHTKSMWYALWMMLRTKNKNQNRKISKGSMFELAKIEVAKNSSQLHKGKTVSKETREKLSKSCQGRESAFKGKTHSESSKKSLAESRSKPCVSPSGERFDSTKEAGIAYNITGVAIRGRIQRGNSGWRYEQDEDQSIVEANRKPKKIKSYKPQSKEHIQKRIAARAISGHYKDREATITRMSVAAKLKHTR